MEKFVEVVEEKIHTDNVFEAKNVII